MLRTLFLFILSFTGYALGASNITDDKGISKPLVPGMLIYDAGSMDMSCLKYDSVRGMYYRDWSGSASASEQKAPVAVEMESKKGRMTSTRQIPAKK